MWIYFDHIWRAHRVRRVPLGPLELALQGFVCCCCYHVGAVTQHWPYTKALSVFNPWAISLNILAKNGCTHLQPQLLVGWSRGILSSRSVWATIPSDISSKIDISFLTQSRPYFTTHHDKLTRSLIFKHFIEYLTTVIVCGTLLFQCLGNRQVNLWSIQRDPGPTKK